MWCCMGRTTHGVSMDVCKHVYFKKQERREIHIFKYQAHLSVCYCHFLLVVVSLKCLCAHTRQSNKVRLCVSIYFKVMSYENSYPPLIVLRHRPRGWDTIFKSQCFRYRRPEGGVGADASDSAPPILATVIPLRCTSWRHR